MPKALGLVETRGLVAAIEAADAMVKAANVTLVGKERTDPALITIKVVGETAAVRASVDAGAAAASRVGVLVSTHIIPQPDLQMISLLPEIQEETKSVRKKTSSPEEKSDIISEVKPVIEKSAREKPVKVKQRQKPIPKVKIEKPLEESEKSLTSSDTISRLRKEALGIKEEPAPSAKSKSKINMAEIEILNVHQLRRLARNTEGFPIQGREISKANRNELLDHFKKLL